MDEAMLVWLGCGAVLVWFGHWVFGLVLIAFALASAQ